MLLNYNRQGSFSLANIIDNAVFVDKVTISSRYRNTDRFNIKSMFRFDRITDKDKVCLFKSV